MPFYYTRGEKVLLPMREIEQTPCTIFILHTIAISSLSEHYKHAALDQREVFKNLKTGWTRTLSLWIISVYTKQYKNESRLLLFPGLEKIIKHNYYHFREVTYRLPDSKNLDFNMKLLPNSKSIDLWHLKLHLKLHTPIWKYVLVGWWIWRRSLFAKICKWLWW